MSWPISVHGYEPKHLSYSSADGYRTCPKRFYFQKVLQVEQRPGLAAIAGNVIHAVCDRIDEDILANGWGDAAVGDCRRGHSTVLTRHP